MSVTVPVPSGEKALLVITFSAEIRCITSSSIPDNGECKVRVLMDGNPVTPGEVYFGSPRDPESPPYGSETHSMQWVAGPITAGTHTIKVQWDMLADARFFVTERTLTVLRSKA